MKNGSSRAQIKITPSQIKMVHTLKSVLGMDDDQYRYFLYERFRVETCKDLTCVQAEELLGSLKQQAVGQGIWKDKNKTARRSCQNKRPGFASQAQLDFIEGLWKDVSRADEQGRTVALRRFLMRQTGVSDLRFLPADKVSAVIEALKQMKSRQQEVEN